MSSFPEPSLSPVKQSAQAPSAGGASEAGVRLRRATPEDVPAIVRLVQTSLGQGGTSWNEAYWRWKHEQNPFGPSPVLVAEANERDSEGGKKLVGVRAFLRWRWACGKASSGSAAGKSNALPSSSSGGGGGARAPAAIEAVRAVDTVTHPDWRGQGIFTRLTERLAQEMKEEEGVAFIFNTPNAQSRPGYLKMGWEVVDQYARWVRPVRFRRCFRALALPETVAPRREPAGAGTLPDVDALLAGPGLPDFLASLPGQEWRYRTTLSEAYLRWRYRDIPGRSYRALWRFDRAGVGAALILRIKDEGRGLRVATVSELLVSSQRQGWLAGRALLHEAKRCVEADYMVALPGRRPRDWASYAAVGFFPLPGRGPHLTARTLNEASCPLDPARREHWRLGAGELEVL